MREHDLLQEIAVLVMTVEPGSPAKQAGVEEGDLIVAFDDRAVAGIDDLHAQLTEARVGVSAKLTVLRDEQKLELTIVPAESVN